MHPKPRKEAAASSYLHHRHLRTSCIYVPHAYCDWASSNAAIYLASGVVENCGPRGVELPSVLRGFGRTWGIRRQCDAAWALASPRAVCFIALYRRAIERGIGSGGE